MIMRRDIEFAGRRSVGGHPEVLYHMVEQTSQKYTAGRGTATVTGAWGLVSVR